MDPTGVTTDASAFEATDCHQEGVESCHGLGGKLKSAPEINGSLPSLVRKTHVVHQIDINFAAKSHRVFEIRCEQQDFAAHA